MSRGHLYVVFGKEYERAAIASVRALRKVSALPVHIITNLRESEQSHDWRGLRITFKVLDMVNQQNRSVKTRLDKYTLFDETLYTDCDTIIRSKEFMTAFDILQGCDVAFPMHTRKESNDRLATKVYQQSVKAFSPTSPLFVYQGGVCVFKKNKRTTRFFELWNFYWSQTQFRDMPGLMCAVHNVRGVSIGILPRSFGFDNSKVIQHFYGWNPPKDGDMPQFVKDSANEKKMVWQPRKCFR